MPACRWWMRWLRAIVVLACYLSLGSIQATLLLGGCLCLAKHQGSQLPAAPLRLEGCTKLARVILQQAAASHQGRPQHFHWPATALQGWPRPAKNRQAVLPAATLPLWRLARLRSHCRTWHPPATLPQWRDARLSSLCRSSQHAATLPPQGAARLCSPHRTDTATLLPWWGASLCSPLRAWRPAALLLLLRSATLCSPATKGLQQARQPAATPLLRASPHVGSSQHAWQPDRLPRLGWCQPCQA